MNIFKIGTCLDADVDVREGADWRKVGKLKLEQGSLILTDVSEQESDVLLDIQRNYDIQALRGIRVSLHVKGGNQEDDPPDLCLLALPQKEQIVRHQDQYYLVKLVCQSSRGSASVFVNRLTLKEVSELMDT